jgi:hypothetical protein
MSKKKCCCGKKHHSYHQECCCCNSGSNYSGGLFGGGNGCTPIIFLLIACGSGLLNCNKSYLIILLFILCGGCFSGLFGDGNNQGSCC